LTTDPGTPLAGLTVRTGAMVIISSARLPAEVTGPEAWSA